MNNSSSFNSRKEYLKYCYEYCKSVYFNNIKLRELKNKFKMTVDDPIFFAKCYAMDYLNMTEEEFEKEKQEIIDTAIINNMESRYMCDLFEILRKEENEEEIIEILKDYDDKMRNLKGIAYDYVRSFRPLEIDTLVDSLRSKIDIYLNYRKELKVREKEVEKNLKEIQLLPFAIKYVNDFLLDDLNKEQFCQKNSIDLKYFDDCLAVLGKYNEDLYLKYKEKIDKQKSNRFAIISENIKRIIEYIKNGVQEDNNLSREFDIIDYYSITKLNFEEIEKMGKNILSNEELRYLRTFISKNKMVKPINLNQIMNEKNIVGVQTDEKGNIIEGTGREITIDEKQEVINYLNNNNIPINTKTYRIALKRYINNNLIKEDENINNEFKAK